MGRIINLRPDAHTVRWIIIPIVEINPDQPLVECRSVWPITIKSYSVNTRDADQTQCCFIAINADPVDKVLRSLEQAGLLIRGSKVIPLP
jgi:hypothetical protein